MCATQKLPQPPTVHLGPLLASVGHAAAQLFLMPAQLHNYSDNSIKSSSCARPMQVLLPHTEGLSLPD
jgi:hypothetical protein